MANIAYLPEAEAAHMPIFIHTCTSGYLYKLRSMLCKLYGASGLGVHPGGEFKGPRLIRVVAFIHVSCFGVGDTREGV